MEQIEKEVIQHGEQIKTLFDRVSNFEKLAEGVNSLAKSVERLALTQSQQKDTIDRMSSDIDDIKKKPEKRWETVVSCVITAIVTAVITMLVKGG